MVRIISSALSPNTDRDDIREAWRVLFRPQSWLDGESVEKVEDWFRNYFNVDTAVAFNSGRSALLALLKCFGIGQGDEVLIQAFTCVAVPNSIRWAGAKPVYVDVDNTLNIDPDDLRKKLTTQTKAVIVQHTFGVPAQMEAIVAFTRKHNLVLIEDCAHSLGATYKRKKIGTFGDAAFFSFGRDKAISSVWGGITTLNIKYSLDKTRGRQKSNIKNKLKKYHHSLQEPSIFWIFQQLLHPLAFSLILPTYQSGLGKALLVVLQKVKLLSLPVYAEEKQGRQPAIFPAKYPNALARLVLKQLSKLNAFIEQRRQTVRYYSSALSQKAGYNFLPYSEEAGWLRFPVLVEHPQKVIAKARKVGVYLGNWYHHVIDPSDVDYKAVGYRSGSCPRAENAASHIINLPTRISVAEAQRVIEALFS